MIWFVCLFRTHFLTKRSQISSLKILEIMFVWRDLWKFWSQAYPHFHDLADPTVRSVILYFHKIFSDLQAKANVPLQRRLLFSFCWHNIFFFSKRKRQRNIRMAWDKLRCMLTKHIESPGSMHLKPKLVAIKKHFCQIFTYLFEIEPF